MSTFVGVAMSPLAAPIELIKCMMQKPLSLVRYLSYLPVIYMSVVEYV